MTLDLRLSCGVCDHPKIIRLCRRAGEGAFRNLVRLWSWAREYRPSGDLGGLDDEEIELAAGWTGEPGVFVGQLRGLKLLDPDGRIHGWSERQGWAVGQERRQEAARKANAVRWERERGQALEAVRTPKGSPVPVRSGSEEDHKPDSEADSAEDPVGTPPSPSPLPSPLPSLSMGLVADSESAHADTSDVHTEIGEERPKIGQVLGYAREIGCPAKLAREWHDARQSTGWRIQSGQTIVDWKANLRLWFQRSPHKPPPPRPPEPPPEPTDPELARESLAALREILPKIGREVP